MGVGPNYTNSDTSSDELAIDFVLMIIDIENLPDSQP